VSFDASSELGVLGDGSSSSDGVSGTDGSSSLESTTFSLCKNGSYFSPWFPTTFVFFGLAASSPEFLRLATRLSMLLRLTGPSREFLRLT
jgi:hypothetical protein